MVVVGVGVGVVGGAGTMVGLTRESLNVVKQQRVDQPPPRGSLFVATDSAVRPPNIFLEEQGMPPDGHTLLQ